MSVQDTASGSRRPRPASLAFALGAALIGGVSVYALRHAGPSHDDFVFFALARHIDSPWPLLAQDSVGSYFYRPLVMLAWWLAALTVGESTLAQQAVNIAAHIATGALTYALMRRLGIRDSIAALAALAFIAHPATVSTAAWLSARFDLFAGAFGVAAWIAVDRHLERPSAGTLAAAGALTLASILSKEIGYAIALAAAAMAVWIDRPRHAASRGARCAVVAAIVLAIAISFLLRVLLLRPVPPTDDLLWVLLGMLVRGTGAWLASAADFIVVSQGSRLVVALWMATLAAIVLLALRSRPWPLAGDRRGARTVALGLGLMLLAAAVQSPTLSYSPLFAYRMDAFDGAALMSARFHYVSSIGLALAVAAFAEAALRVSLPRAVAYGLAMLALLAVAGLTATSRGIARQWGAYSAAHGEAFAAPAVQAVAALRGLAPGCKIYLLDTPPEASAFREFADVAVKRSLPRGHPALGCFIQAEHAPWYHLLARAGLPPAAEGPFEIIEAGGRPYPPLPVGNLVYYFVRIPPGRAALDDPRASFLSFRQGRFVDVTTEVRAGGRVPKLFDRRG